MPFSKIQTSLGLLANVTRLCKSIVCSDVLSRNHYRPAMPNTLHANFARLARPNASDITTVYNVHHIAQIRNSIIFSISINMVNLFRNKTVIMSECHAMSQHFDVVDLTGQITSNMVRGKSGFTGKASIPNFALMMSCSVRALFKTFWRSFIPNKQSSVTIVTEILANMLNRWHVQSSHGADSLRSGQGRFDAATSLPARIIYQIQRYFANPTVKLQNAIAWAEKLK